jgi:hypothetical protein
MIEVALDTGMPVLISPKFTAEHMWLPWQQSSIRELEIDYQAGSEEHLPSSLMSLSAGSLRYTRYGYADFLKEDRRYGVLWRMWPGSQRMLLWGDPAMAAGYGRTAHFCGCDGLDFCEPLSFKGRMGSGLPGGRLAYADPSLITAEGDFYKYDYTYRLWGRLLYDPNTNPDAWRRYLRHEFGEASRPAEAALSHASRIIPLVTTAYHPSASNNRYWPEMYTSLPIVKTERDHPYRDTPVPRIFSAATALDPGMFSSINEFVEEMISDKQSGKSSPLRVARWLDGLSSTAGDQMQEARRVVTNPMEPAFRRLLVDVSIQSTLGRFFAGKLRAGVGWALYQRTGSRERLVEAIVCYKTARSALAEAAQVAQGVYRDDITVGMEPWVRGHWMDRLPSIDADIADMEEELRRNPVRSDGPKYSIQPLDLLCTDDLPEVQLIHQPPDTFRPGGAVKVLLALGQGGDTISSISLHYRHVNQAERYCIVEMARSNAMFVATIPARYTHSPFPLQYYFKLRTGNGTAWFWPGFGDELASQPYFVVRQQRQVL